MLDSTKYTPFMIPFNILIILMHIGHNSRSQCTPVNVVDWFWIIALKLKSDNMSSCHRFTHSRHRKENYHSLSAYQRRIWQRHTTRISLLPANHSPWMQLVLSGNDQAMKTLTGFDVISFECLCGIFAPVLENYSPCIDCNGKITVKSSTRVLPQLIQP